MAAVRVVAEDGAELAVMDWSADVRISDLLDIFHERGLRGYLLRDGRRCFPSQALQAEETYTFVEEGVEPWFVEHRMVPAASSLATSLRNMNKFLTHGRPCCPMYNMGRTSPSTTPLALAVQAFGIYARCFRNFEGITRADVKFEIDCMDMSDFYVDENARRHAFARHLKTYLTSSFSGITFSVIESRPELAVPDITVKVLVLDELISVISIVVKPELGFNGEPCVQNLRYYVADTISRKSELHWSYQLSCCPMLAIEVVGATVRVGGLARFLDKPAYEPFTSYLHINRFLQDEVHQQSLSRSLSALRPAVDSLIRFYMDLKMNSAQTGRVTNRNPSIDWPYFVQRLSAAGAHIVRFTREVSMPSASRVDEYKLVFFVRHQDGTQKIVKFCQRYGSEAHRAWADAGRAPNFEESLLDGGWRVITMDYYAAEDGWRPLTALDPTMADVPGVNNSYRLDLQQWNACKGAVKQAHEGLKLAHPLLVHGDLRMQNIFYNVTSSKVGFADFAWAGIHKQQRYPLNINTNITWAAGVEAGALMSSRHDSELLDLQLE